MTSRPADQMSGDAHARFTALVHQHQRGLLAHVRVVYPHVDADTESSSMLSGWDNRVSSIYI